MAVLVIFKHKRKIQKSEIKVKLNRKTLNPTLSIKCVGVQIDDNLNCISLHSWNSFNPFFRKIILWNFEIRLSLITSVSWEKHLITWFPSVLKIGSRSVEMFSATVNLLRRKTIFIKIVSGLISLKNNLSP